MHMFLDKFDELNTRQYREGIKEDDLDDYPESDYIRLPKDGKYQIKSKYYTDERFNPLPVVIVDYDTAKKIESLRYTDHPLMSIHFTTIGTKYKYLNENNEAVEFRGAVFNDESMIRNRLEVLKSEEVELIRSE